MILELFEKFAVSNTHKRTLVFMAFGGEELGLLGSKHFVNNPTIDLQKVQLMVNLVAHFYCLMIHLLEITP